MTQSRPEARATAAAPLGQPADPPRPVTAKVRRRAWREPGVVGLVMIGLLLLIAMGIFMTEQIITASKDQYLFENGAKVTARVEEISGVKRLGYSPADLGPITLSFELNGKQHKVTRLLEARTIPLRVGDSTALLVDPSDPEGHWTDRTQPVSFMKELLLGFVLLPFALMALTMAVLKRGSIVRTWETGQSAQALVMNAGASALSRNVSLALVGSGDRRLIKLGMPRHMTALKKGDSVWVIMPRGKPQRSILAMLYQ